MPELHVRVVCARNLIDKQTFGKQDPYCKVTVRNRTFKTRVHDNGDKSPVWNERFTFETHDPQLDQLRIEVKDKNFTASTLIGSLFLPVNMFMSGNVVDEWYSLNNGSKRAGEINLRIQLIGVAGKPGKTPAAATTAYTQPQAYPVAQATYPAPQAYPPQQQHYAPPPQQYPPQQYPPPQQQQYPPPQQYPPQQYPPPQQQQMYPPQQHYPPPQQPGYAYAQAPPPPMMMAPPPPMMYGAPAPVMYGAPPPMVYVGGHGGGHGHKYGKHGKHGKHGGGAGEMAMGVGAGVLGGMILGDVLFD